MAPEPEPKVIWKRARMSKPRNNLPDVAFKPKVLPPFIPSYERDCQVDMWKLMTDDYKRMWFDQIVMYRKVHRQKRGGPSSGHDSNSIPVLRRRLLSRAHAKFAGKLVPMITLKRFQNIPARTDSGMKNRKPLTPEA